MPQMNRQPRGRLDLDIVHRTPVATTILKDKCGEKLELFNRGLSAHPALKTIASIGRKLQFLTSATNGIGPPEGRLEKNILGGGAYGRALPAHDACQSDWPL